MKKKIMITIYLHSKIKLEKLKIILKGNEDGKEIIH